ncbi:MAG: uncharacterized protein Athens071426_642 [Parcubacteria group bacterium Athens0714_26]|nr:MAG: uncharacterized protein Athens071426_642 [Parcubacteria group bacterium Athens0714_26]
MQSTYLIEDTLVVQGGDSYIVYSPFSGKIARVFSFPEKGTEIFLSLHESGFFNALPESTRKDDIETWRGFRSLTLLVTRSCNLACIYCYAAAKKSGRTMSLNLALQSLKWFAEQFKGNTIRISFHGGGEPTLEFALIQEVVKEAYYLAQKSSKKTRFQIVTNGTASIGIFDWFIDNNFGISISADGPAFIQNRNRPFVNGKGSSEIVEKNIRYLVSRNYPFTIRLTFSSIDDIREIVRYFGNLGVKSLHVEPLFPHGREYKRVIFGKESEKEVYSPDGKEFVTSFFKAMGVAREFGIRITNSHIGHLTKGLGYFCGSASGRSMIVTDEGFISGCLEVVDDQDSDFELLKKIHLWLMKLPLLDFKIGTVAFCFPVKIVLQDMCVLVAAR